MEFHYYYLLQDIIGVLLGALSFKMIILYLLHIKNKGPSKHSVLCVLGNVMMLMSGTSLVASQFGIRAWIAGAVLFIFGCMFACAAHRTQITKTT